MKKFSIRALFAGPAVLIGVAGLLVVGVAFFVPAILTSKLLAFFGTLILFLALLWQRRLETKALVMLAGTKEQSSGILEQFPDALIVYDAQNHILLFNRAAENIFGISRAMVLGKTLGLESEKGNPALGVFVKTFFPSLAPSVKKISASYPELLEVEFDQPKRVTLAVTTMPFRSPQGRDIGFVKIIRDVTREHEISKMKSEFISIAAHQLRTPLAAVRWIFAMLKGGDMGALSPAGQKVVEDGLVVSEKLIKLVGDLLNVSRIEEGKFGYKLESGDFAAFLEKLVQDLRITAQERKVTLSFEKPAAALPALTFDSEKLSIAVSNIIDNAIKYNQPNGRVDIKTMLRPNEPFIEVSVEDTGVGIPQAEAQRVFSKFFRGSNVIKSETEGSGLGLFIAKNIIERHGGKTFFESHEGKGTRVVFTLPFDPNLIPKEETAAG